MSGRLRSGARFVAGAAVALVMLSAAPTANASTLVGQLPPGDTPNICSGPLNGIQASVASGQPYEMPFDGVITAWAHRGDSALPGAGRLQLWRRGEGTTATLVGRSDPATFASGIVNAFATRIPVVAGDVLGMHIEGQTNSCSSNGVPGDALRFAGFGPPDPLPGDTLNFGSSQTTRLNLAAILEPDADCDGFGDETQDGSINALDCDKTPPEAMITSGPAAKTRKRDATFEFTSSEPGSTFQCQLDGGAFFNCGTPLGLLKVKKGSHTFAVRAKDPAGNVDETPATQSWIIKRKKRKHKH